MIDKIKEYAKFLAALLTAIVTSFAGLIPAEWGPWVQAGIALLGAIAVLAIPNQLTDAQVVKAAKHLEDPSAVAASLVSEENRRQGF